MENSLKEFISNGGVLLNFGDERKEKGGIEKTISPYPHPVDKRKRVGWLSVQFLFIHKLGRFKKFPPICSQVMHKLYKKRIIVCG